MSPAIDLVSLANCTDQTSPTPQPLGTDQRLFARPDPANLNACDSGAYEAGAIGPYTLNSERVQVARSIQSEFGDVKIGLLSPLMATPTADLAACDVVGRVEFWRWRRAYSGHLRRSSICFWIQCELFPFVVHTVNHESYGTLFPDQQLGDGFTLSARMVALPTPSNTCGAWTLNLEVSALSLAKFDLTGSNPFALILTDGDGNQRCFDIANAIVGNLIPTPAHGVRRAVRRQVRR